MTANIIDNPVTAQERETPRIAGYRLASSGVSGSYSR
jgi:hypothetical protein